MNRNVTATILIVLALGIYFTVTKGIIADGQSVQALNKQYTDAINNAQRLISVRDQVRTNYNNVSADDKARLDKMLPSTVDNIRLIIDLNNLALSHGMTFANIRASVGSGSSQTPTGKTAGQSTPILQQQLTTGGGAAANNSLLADISAPVLDTVTVSFNVNANYEQFISLLQDIEADLRIMDITHLSMQSSENGVYTWNLEFKTYWIHS